MNRDFLSGYRTYVLAAMAVLGSLVAWGLGEMTLSQAIEAAWAGGVAASLRAGIAKVG